MSVLDRYGFDGAILEGVVTTTNADGSTNVAALGPIVDTPLTHAILRPFPTSVSYTNLLRERRCILHVTDDVLLIAQAALDGLTHPPATEKSPHGAVLADCCHWFALEVAHVKLEGERPEFHCQVVKAGQKREFFGLSRSKAAVIEAAILASRVKWLPPEQISHKMGELKTVIDKTASERDRAAFEFVEAYLRVLRGRGAE
jgi:uncharacterized protein